MGFAAAVATAVAMDDNYDDDDDVGEMVMMMTWCGRGSTRSKQRCVVSRVEAATKVYRENEESINQTDKAERLEEAEKKPH